MIEARCACFDPTQLRAEDMTERGEDMTERGEDMTEKRGLPFIQTLNSHRLAPLVVGIQIPGHVYVAQGGMGQG